MYIQINCKQFPDGLFVAAPNIDLRVHGFGQLGLEDKVEHAIDDNADDNRDKGCAESFEKQYYVGAWEKETERQIRMYLSESGIPGAAVSVTLEPGNTGEAKEIRIEAPMRQTSIYREEQKKQREMLDEKLTEIKSVLSEVYGTDPAHIMVEISE